MSASASLLGTLLRSYFGDYYKKCLDSPAVQVQADALKLGGRGLLAQVQLEQRMAESAMLLLNDPVKTREMLTKPENDLTGIELYALQQLQRQSHGLTAVGEKWEEQSLMEFRKRLRAKVIK